MHISRQMEAIVYISCYNDNIFIDYEVSGICIAVVCV